MLMGEWWLMKKGLIGGTVLEMNDSQRGVVQRDLEQKLAKEAKKN
jgi:hypothetical protein